MKSQILEKLEQLAYKRSNPFCLSCYRVAKSGRCNSCGSDDLAREVPSVGCDWGSSWIIEHILKEELNPVGTDEAFEDFVRGCYPETTQVLWGNFDSVQLMKDHDPISWKLARDEWESQEEEEGNIISLDNGSTYYWTHDVEHLLEAL